MTNYLIVMIERGGMVIVKLLTLIVLSRYLSPEDFGLFGIVSVIIAISLILVDSGFGGALIKEKKPTELDYSTVFVVNLALSIILSLIILIVAPLVSIFYDKSIIADLMQVSVLVLFIRALSLINIIILTRKMKFLAQAVINLIAVTIGSAVAIYFAYIGVGVWALIYQQLVEALVTFLGFFFLVQKKISIKFSLDSFRKFYNFGFSLTLSSLIRSLYDNLSILIIGKVFTIQTLGYYTQANRVNSLYTTFLVGVVDKVSFVSLSNKFNTSLEDFYNEALRLLKVVLLLGGFVSLFMASFSVEIIEIILGDKWRKSAYILTFISYCGIGMIFETITRIFLKSAGRADIILKIEIIKKTISVVLMLLFVNFGLNMFLCAMLLSSVMAVIVNSFYVRLSIDITYTMQMKAAFPVIVAMAFFVSFGGCFNFHFFNSPVLNLILITIIMFSMYMVVFLYSNYLMNSWLLARKR